MKKIILLILTVFSFFSAKLIGQNCLLFSTTNYTYSYIINPGVLVSNDFNNDGKKDLVVSLYDQTSFTNYFGVYIQTTANNFNTYTLSGGGGVFSADYNADGKNDILSAGTTFLGTGTGSFTTIPNNLGGLSLANNMVDFDNDGKLDLMGNYYTGIVTDFYFCKGLSNGTFSTVISFTNNGYGGYMIGCNLNNDMNKDLIIYSSTCFFTNIITIDIFSGNGNGTFTPISTLTYTTDCLQGNPTVGQSQSIKVSDIDNDGKEDIALTFASNQFAILKGNGNFTFNAPVYSALNYFPLEVIDLNNDGFKDVITIQPVTGTGHIIQSLFTNGSNSLVNPNTFSTTNTVASWGSKIIADDFNNDGKIDFAVDTYSGSTSVNFFFANSSCIWPGDANRDGIANNVDVLELGLHINQIGATRTSTSNAWNSYSCTPWTGTVTTGANLNNSDCNGDGTINANDTLAVFSNYGFLHNLKEAAVISATPQISIVPDQATVYKGTWGTASIYLGDASNPISNINGVAFTTNYNKTLLQTDSVYVEYIPSFINANNLHFRKKAFTAGALYTSTTHTNNLNVNGNGKIGILHYKIKPSLVSDSVLNLSLSAGFKMSATGSLTPLTVGAGTLLATTTTVNSIYNNTLGITNAFIYPNPSNGLITVALNKLPQKDVYLSVYNGLGQLLKKEIINKQYQNIDLNLAPGIYFCEIKDANENVLLKNKMVIR